MRKANTNTVPCLPDHSQTKSQRRKEKAMCNRLYLFALASVLLAVGIASAQDYPILDRVAQKVIQKYQTASCQQLAEEKSQPPTGQRAEMEQRAIGILRNDPQMRVAFINQVAAPIANKLFECGMIP
jgi:hypothetical protein